MYNFSKLGRLSKLDLSRNQFTGTFPTSLYSCKSLKAIRLSANDIEGQIQPEILSLKSLSYLSLSFNRLTNITGAIKILMHCESLTFLTFASSFEEEEVPAVLGMADFDGFKNLQLLDLSKNENTGQIPIWLSKLKNLEELCSLPMLVSQNNTLSTDNLELPMYFTDDSKSLLSLSLKESKSLDSHLTSHLRGSATSIDSAAPRTSATSTRQHLALPPPHLAPPPPRLRKISATSLRELGSTSPRELGSTSPLSPSTRQHQGQRLDSPTTPFEKPRISAMDSSMSSQSGCVGNSSSTPSFPYVAYEEMTAGLQASSLTTPLPPSFAPEDTLSKLVFSSLALSRPRSIKALQILSSFC
ncbi:hypothetical protein ACLB2K_021230 [Fragaria x ananassa]